MSQQKKLRVLVVDDTVVYRKVVGDALSDLPGVEVVGTASNGKIAMSKIDSLRPDILTLDIEMPEMSGLDVLKEMKSMAPHVEAIVISTLTHKSGELTMKALELGAFDFITKPEKGCMEENRKEIKRAIAPMLKAFCRHKEIKDILKGNSSGSETKINRRSSTVNGIMERMRTIAGKKRVKAEIIGIGVSTGGPRALADMLPMIPSDFSVPILIVQHMPPIFTKSLAMNLDSKCAFDVKEAVDGEPVKGNTALIAPGGKQMKVAAGADGTSRIIRITDDPPENSCRPSVDYLFRSIARYYVGRSTGVIMTGMGSDGTQGLKLMKRSGSYIIAQNEETCVVYGMPKEPIEIGLVDAVVPLERIASEIYYSVNGVYFREKALGNS
ncbi:MAG: chemotaxis response regulator protein-glutamate methylesterase [Deltaproteobacteria bacterium]|nr:chemotaxis response regulator protein-glutamate methylesterase [Deltaproteobacteria bacterium]